MEIGVIASTPYSLGGDNFEGQRLRVGNLVLFDVNIWKSRSECKCQDYDHDHWKHRNCYSPDQVTYGISVTVIFNQSHTKNLALSGLQIYLSFTS